MATKTINIRQSDDPESAIRDAAGVLNDGGLVIFPTETVYGVGARADRPDALKRLYEVKNRPTDQPFTVHIGRREDADAFVPEPSTTAKQLMKKAWPGPLTLLLSVDDPGATPVAEKLGENGVSHVFKDGVVGLRCPDSFTACNLLSLVDGPVVAASANLAGKQPPRTVEDALADLDGEVAVALDEGPAMYNVPSTIAKVAGNTFEIVREGIFDERMLTEFERVGILFVCTGNTCRSPMAWGLARDMLAKRFDCRIDDLADRKIDVLSAGTGAFPGAPPSENAVAVMADRSIDISMHTADMISGEMVHRADHVFTMTGSHRQILLHLQPDAVGYVHTLLETGDIADPIGGSKSDYEECAKQIEAAIDARLKEIDL